MSKTIQSTQFATLFKRYRLRSEIETLSEFGNLLADEGLIYESSLFTKWQKGIRIPKERKTLISIIRIFSERGGVHSIHEVNNLLEAAGQGYLTESELTNFPLLHISSQFQAPRKIEHFVKRKGYVKYLLSSLRFGKSVLLYGQPGIGKTVLATDIAHQLSNHFSDGVFWYQLNTVSAMDTLASIAEIFGQNIRSIQDISVRAAIVRSITFQKKALFIFDNIDKQEDLLYLMPNNKSCSVLITSIHPYIAIPEIDIRIGLKPFSQKEALSLFQTIFGKQYITENRNEIIQLYNLVQGLPLAFHVLAKHILYFQKSISFFIHSISHSQTNLSSFLYENKNLHTVLEICFKKLSLKNQQILVSTAVFGGKDFSIEAVAFINKIKEEEAQGYLEQLWNFSLIEKLYGKRYRIHPFIRIFLLKNLPKVVYAKCAQYYLETIKLKKRTYFIFLQEELDNILPLFEHISNQEMWKSLSGIWYYLSDYLWNAGKWDVLKFYSQKILQLCDVFNDYKTKIRVCLIPLSLLYFWRNDLERAKKYISEGLDLAKKHNDQFLIHLGKQRLGKILRNSDSKTSLKLLNESYTYFLSIDNPVEMNIVQTNLGEIALKNNDYDKALEHFRQAQIFCHRIDDVSLKIICLAELLFYFGAIKLLENQWEEGYRNFIKGLELCQKINEYSEISTAGYIGLGLYNEHKKNSAEALHCYQKIIRQIEFLGIKESIISQDTFFLTLQKLISNSPIFNSIIKL